MKAGAVVVGGGVMGVSIALRLAEQLDALAAPVILLEKTELGAGSSGRSGAIVRQFYSHRELASMARDSLKVFAGFESSTGRSIGFHACGVLTIAGPEGTEHGAADREFVRANVAMMQEIGIRTELVDAERMRALVAGIAVLDGSLGAWEPEAGFVDPKRTVAAFAELAKTRGLIVRTSLGADELFLDGGRVRGVRTRDGLIETERVVVAAGAWSRALLAPLGIEAELRAIRPDQHFVSTPDSDPGGGPRRQGMFGTQGAREPDRDLDDRFSPPEQQQAAHPVLLDLENLAYFRCEPDDGRTRIGGMDVSGEAEVPDPDELDENVPESFRRFARAALERRMPVYARCPDAGSLAGLYTMTPDGQAIIGEVGGEAGSSGLFLVAGFSGHGFKLAPSIGEGVAQLVLGAPVSAFEPAFFSRARFAAGRATLGRGFGL